MTDNAAIEARKAQEQAERLLLELEDERAAREKAEKRLAQALGGS